MNHIKDGPRECDKWGRAGLRQDRVIIFFQYTKMLFNSPSLYFVKCACFLPFWRTYYTRKEDVDLLQKVCCLLSQPDKMTSTIIYKRKCLLLGVFLGPPPPHATHTSHILRKYDWHKLGAIRCWRRRGRLHDGRHSKMNLNYVIIIFCLAGKVLCCGGGVDTWEI